ncbi:MAG: sigma-54 dependent transcriptional regulator [Myxococcales bacterium]|nr:sigma-54 dependent transcriptional regulator [Polyangiaceae bacterium]MDW8248891.1 sigma-54 dependent transcriptional regulator [Myxococcales bacterium]
MNEPRPHVLIIDDEQEICELLAIRLEHNSYRVTAANNGSSGLSVLEREHVDAMILDLRLGEENGLNVLSEVQQRSPDIPVVILTAHGTIDTAVEAMKRGAYGFLTKPFHDHDLLQKLAHAVESSSLRREVAGLRQAVGAQSKETRLLGTSTGIARVREMIARVAPTDATVLITGESGTGKELAARAIHALSPRSDGPFVAVNCGAIPAELLESELFGHIKGSFTGALRDKAGLFAAARGGTLFLDEIGEASPAVQVKLLRVLQERTFSRVGSTIEEETDARVLAATNRDLRTLVTEGTFRQDLFYRLHVVPLAIPPLRERQSDIPWLARVFLERAASRHNRPTPRLTRDAVSLLLSHRWPGNVRELANVMEAALLLSRGDQICADDLRQVLGPTNTSPPPSFSSPSVLPSSPSGLDGLLQIVQLLQDEQAVLPQLREARDIFEKTYLTELMRRTGGNVTVASRMAGRNRTDFYELLRRHQLSASDFKE